MKKTLKEFFVNSKEKVVETAKSVAKTAGVVTVIALASIGTIVVATVIASAIESKRDPEGFHQQYIAELEESLAEAKK